MSEQDHERNRERDHWQAIAQQLGLAPEPGFEQAAQAKPERAPEEPPRQGAESAAHRMTADRDITEAQRARPEPERPAPPEREERSEPHRPEAEPPLGGTPEGPTGPD